VEFVVIVDAKHIARAATIDPADGFTVAIGVEAAFFAAGSLNLSKP
jgi:hypothetical protein